MTAARMSAAVPCSHWAGKAGAVRATQAEHFLASTTLDTLVIAAKVHDPSAATADGIKLIPGP